MNRLVFVNDDNVNTGVSTSSNGFLIKVDSGSTTFTINLLSLI